MCLKPLKKKIKLNSLESLIGTAQKTHSVITLKTNELVMYRETICVVLDIHKNDTYVICGQNVS
jgi:hypothetical protein